jgi:pyocin large subunit-like protein
LPGRLSRLSRLLCAWLCAVLLSAAGPGFRNGKLLDEHYRKHGPEFGNIGKTEYLRLAQELWDAPPGGPILQAVKAGSVITKFDRRKGYFGAYNRDGVIRTFFIPTNGERYFWRQAKRGPSGHD